MTKASYICNLIHDNPNSWKEICEEKQIKVKEQEELAIFNYDIMANFADPVVQEARGIIINTAEQKVVAWPFRKFGNSYEAYVDTIDWKTARVQEKLDGSIIKLYYNKLESRWKWASNSCIDASQAKLSTKMTLMSLIESTPEYEQIKKGIWNGAEWVSTDYTYIFELVGPYNQIVVRYDESHLYHIGTRNNKTGAEMVLNIGIPKPKEYKLQSLEECIEAAKELNKGEYPDNEGFVVVDNDWHRMKVKCPEYLIYHHAVNNGVITKQRAMGIMNTDDFNMDEFRKAAPIQAVTVLEYYVKRISEETEKAVQSVKDARKMAESGMTRKDIALALKGNKYSFFAFKGIDCTDEAEEIVRRNREKLANNIEDFEV